MKKYFFITTLFLTTLILSGCENTGTGGDSSSSDNTTISVNLTNNYGTAIRYEVWTGTSLSYDGGTVRGQSLVLKLDNSTTDLADSGSDSFSLSSGTEFLLVIGVVSGSDIFYLTDTKLTAANANINLTLDAQGFLQSS